MQSSHPIEGLVVTTARNRRAEFEPRALSVAARCGLKMIPREKSLQKVLLESGAWGAYVVGHQHESVQAEETSLFVGPAMFYLKRLDGMEHPLIRAISPASGGGVETVIDATMGLAGDALHISHSTGAVVMGFERSPVVCCLLDEGLRRMSAEKKPWATAAARLKVECGAAALKLSRFPESSVDVIYIDPMFELPGRCSPGFGLFRRIADHAPLRAELIQQACRVASRRVVLKLPGGAQPPSIVPHQAGWNRRVRGKSVDFLVAEFELESPEYEAPDHGTRP